MHTQGINLATEKAITMVEATQVIAEIMPGRQLSAATMRLWARQGLYAGAVKLEVVYIGRDMCTSREAIFRFLRKLNASRDEYRNHIPPAPVAIPDPPATAI